MGTSTLRTVYICQSCGFHSPKWLGRCPGCGEWETLAEEAGRGRETRPSSSPSLSYGEIEELQVFRLETENREFDRVLGGGVVPGSLILLGGEPGIGKSTLLLQIAESLSVREQTVLYVAGEESVQQIRLRGERLGLEGTRLFLAPETCLEQILAQARQLKPRVLMVDSIQTLYTEALESVPGSISQVRECAARLLRFAKEENVPVFLIGHITKDGSLAGPKALEHIVDVVLYFEGDRHQNQKIVRAVKNRFGPANELGVFEMTSQGLVCVENPSELFLSERSDAVSGSVVVSALQGSRPMLVELQALVSQSHYSAARRMTNGVDPNRVSLLLAMLEKRLGFHLLASDVYVNVVGGLSLSEPAVDLALVAAILSSFRDVPVPPRTVIFGEVGLAGEVRAVNWAQVRVKEALSLGLRRVILPLGNLPLTEDFPDLHLQGVGSVSDFLEVVDS